MSKVYIVQIETGDFQDNYTVEVRASSSSEAGQIARQGLGRCETVGTVWQKYKSKKKKARR